MTQRDVQRCMAHFFSRPMWIGFLFLAVSFCSTDFRDFMLCGTLSKDHVLLVQSFLVACKGTAS